VYVPSATSGALRLLIRPDLSATPFALSLSKHSPSTSSGRTVFMFNSCRINNTAIILVTNGMKIRLDFSGDAFIRPISA